MADSKLTVDISAKNLKKLTVPQHSGTLMIHEHTKKRGFKRERRTNKYFVIANYSDGICLFCYADQCAKKADRVYSMMEFESARHYDNKDEDVIGFSIRFEDNKKPLIFICDQERDRQEWVMELNKAIESAHKYSQDSGFASGGSLSNEKIENLRELQEHEVDTSEWQSTDGYNTINDALIGRKDEERQEVCNNENMRDGADSSPNEFNVARRVEDDRNTDVTQLKTPPKQESAGSQLKHSQTITTSPKEFHVARRVEDNRNTDETLLKTPPKQDTAGSQLKHCQMTTKCPKRSHVARRVEDDRNTDATQSKTPSKQETAGSQLKHFQATTRSPKESHVARRIEEDRSLDVTQLKTHSKQETKHILPIQKITTEKELYGQSIKAKQKHDIESARENTTPKTAIPKKKNTTTQMVKTCEQESDKGMKVLDKDKEVELRPQAGRRHSHRTAGVWEEDYMTTNVYENVNGKFSDDIEAVYANANIMDHMMVSLQEDETEASEAFVSVGGQSESFVSVTDGITLDSTETKHVPDYENIKVESWSSGGSSDSNTSGIVKSGSPIVSEEGDYLNAEFFKPEEYLCTDTKEAKRKLAGKDPGTFAIFPIKGHLASHKLFVRDSTEQGISSYNIYEQNGQCSLLNNVNKSETHTDIPILLMHYNLFFLPLLPHQKEKLNLKKGCNKDET